MTMLDQWGRNFSRLMLEVNKHKEGFVDAYFGSPDIAESVKNSPLVLIADLQSQLDELASSLNDSDTQRQKFVAGMITSAKTILRLANNEPLTFHDEARLIFDIEAEPVDEARFDEAQAQLASILPGTGTTAERLQAYLRHYEMDSNQLDTAIELALPETRKRTSDFIDLVDGEGFVYSLVKDQVWSAYN